MNCVFPYNILSMRIYKYTIYEEQETFCLLNTLHRSLHRHKPQNSSPRCNKNKQCALTSDSLFDKYQEFNKNIDKHYSTSVSHQSHSQTIASTLCLSFSTNSRPLSFDRLGRLRFWRGCFNLLLFNFFGCF